MLVQKEIPVSTFNRISWIYPTAFFAVLVIGLIYVKWNPYYYKAFAAAATHSIGISMISGKEMVAPEPSWQAAFSYATAYFTAVWKAVVLGLLLGSLVQVLIPRDWIKEFLGEKSFKSTVFASLVSMPGMMCSCCAAPVTVGLRAQSASVGAALAFFLGNPVLNPATIIFMGFVLSWKFAFFRLVVGLIMVYGIATIANKFAGTNEVPAELYPVSTNVANDGGLFVQWINALRKLVIDTIPAYLIVVLLLGACRAWLFPVIGPDLSNSLLVVIGLAIAGTLFVIPTAAEIPIVQTLLSFGLGVGPAVALLMTLPSVSLPSILIIRKVFPGRVLVFVLVGVAIIGIISGLIAPFVF